MLSAYAEYRIFNHVYFAIEGDVVVFLDLRADRYSMLMGMKAHVFSGMLSRGGVNSRTLICHPSQSDHGDTAELNLVAELLECGLVSALGDVVAEMQAADLPQIPLPREDFAEQHAGARVHVRARDVWNFLIACVIAWWRLRYTTIETTVTAVGRRKLRQRDGSIERSTARKLVHVYNRLRPLVPRDYMCLYDSLSLLEFLSRYKCYPIWVFAVQLEPWAAHCWVQLGAVALNQDAHDAQTYLPIMAV